MTELTHASFFSGVGGLDLGLERAGWRTVSCSEIDPYASAVLARHWPDVPNLGSIVDVRDAECGAAGLVGPTWRDATLWTGGFPCQDLSVAGKRRGMGSHDDRLDTRSGLAYAFLDLVELHRPRAVLLENVPGLLSSHAGRDMAALLGRLVDLGYGVAYRVLNAAEFGVPQRRRRVFIVALRGEADDLECRVAAERAAAVLSVGQSGCWDHPQGCEAGTRTAASAGDGAERAGVGGHAVAADAATSTRTIAAGLGHHGYTLGAQDVDGGWLQLGGGNGVRDAVTAKLGTHGTSGPAGDEHHHLVYPAGPAPDADRMRAPHGLARRLDDRAGVADAFGFAQNQRGEVRDLGQTMSQLTTGGGKPGEGYPAVYVKVSRPRGVDGEGERWAEEDTSPTLNNFDQGDSRAVTLVSAITNMGSGGADDNEAQAGHLDEVPRADIAATLNSGGNDGGFRTEPGEHLVFTGRGATDDDLLPDGLDSHRYRCCGNGVVAPVAEWVGRRLAAYFAGELDKEAA